MVIDFWGLSAKPFFKRLLLSAAKLLYETDVDSVLFLCLPEGIHRLLIEKGAGSLYPAMYPASYLWVLLICPGCVHFLISPDTVRISWQATQGALLPASLNFCFLYPGHLMSFTKIKLSSFRVLYIKTYFRRKNKNSSLILIWCVLTALGVLWLLPPYLHYHLLFRTNHS